MQAYGPGFARAYNRRWSAFASNMAPLIQALYEATPAARKRRTLLDLCCGTGQLAAHFLEQGYRTVGIDLSEPMLQLARENTRAYLESGLASFLHGDVTDFTLGERFGLVVSTYDALNHLSDAEALARCFRCVFAVCEGLFVFDLNTRAGLRRWNNIQVDDSDPDLFVVNRGIYDGESDRAWVKFTGFARNPAGLYERFEETAFNTVFPMARVREMLLEVGWRDVYFANVRDLGVTVEDAEGEGRVFVVARRE